jgi:hypothetical protein
MRVAVAPSGTPEAVPSNLTGEQARHPTCQNQKYPTRMSYPRGQRSFVPWSPGYNHSPTRPVQNSCQAPTRACFRLTCSSCTKYKLPNHGTITPFNLLLWNSKVNKARPRSINRAALFVSSAPSLMTHGNRTNHGKRKTDVSPAAALSPHRRSQAPGRVDRARLPAQSRLSRIRCRQALWRFRTL